MLKRSTPLFKYMALRSRSNASQLGSPPIALTIGILFGIYSSVFVAAAIAMWLGVKREDLIGPTAVKAHDPDDPNAGAVV